MRTITGLNSSLIIDPSRAGDLYQEQWDWLIQELEISNQKHPVHRFIFTHHPFFLTHVDEKDHYFNFPIDKRMLYLNKLKEMGCTACFSGHYHRNAYGNYQGIECITTSAVGLPLGEDPSGFRIIQVHHDHIEHRYYGLEEVPSLISME